MGSSDTKPNTLHLESQTSEFNAIHYMIEQALSRMTKVTLVQVTKTSTTGQVAATGMVSLAPLVKMQDALGNVHAHSVVHNIPYVRLQGGKDKAIIMDPKVGDIGLAVFADRDIGPTKKNNAGWDGTKQPTQTQASPGSYRQHDFADGIYLGCVLGAAPTSYIQFKDDGSIVVSPDNGTTTVTIDHAGKAQVKVGGFKFSIQSSRMDLNCDYNAGTAHVMSDVGPIGNVFCVP